jgi:hypothetical protein
MNIFLIISYQFILNKMNNMNNCAICCDEIQNKEDGFQTPCNHYMHNTCLTHWLLLKNTCPICRHNICGSNNHKEDVEDYSEDEDEEEIQDIQVNFSNEIYTSNYNTILDSLKEIIYLLTHDDEDLNDYRLQNNWGFDEVNNIFNLKVNTRNDIIKINIDTDVYEKVLFLDIQFDTISKKMSKYIEKNNKKDLLISNYSAYNLPTRINCY